MKSQESLRYPIGKFEYGKVWSLDDTRRNIKAIARLPKELKKVLKKLKGGELDTPYRRGGWTARQVVHHLADSHMNAYVRMKLAVTETTPIIKPYEEADWAKTEDAKNAPVKLSLRILAPLHKRWVMFLESLSEEDLERGYFHPEQQRVIPLPEAIALYAWHGQHHVAHIRLIAQGKPKQEETEKPAAAPGRRRLRRSSEEVAAEKAAKAEGPKLTRAEILAKARAARAAKEGAPAAAPKAKKAAKTAKAEGPKLTRAEILAKARAARAAKQGAPAAAPKKAAKAA
ncbi:MAG: putative metal-dependent hydrolase, partial [Haliscomenobacteraceae bacterium CHB4]|nr:putative metal-dependent hydrolase [Haliscomenobacteraceae bacterium CHB4]